MIKENNPSKVLRRPLDISEVDFRVQSINKGGYATILAYKDARVDMNRLDEAFGPFGWQRKHEVVNGNLYCSIGVRQNLLIQGDNGNVKEYRPEWVWKQDVGTESYTEKEKGQASDAFKRAGFNWGIGRELYDYPFIQVQLDKDEYTVEERGAKATWKLRLRDWIWRSGFSNGKLCYLKAIDPTKQAAKVRFEWYNLEGLQDSIEAIRSGITSDDLHGASQAYFELSEGEKLAIMTAESKGGPFTTQERETIKSSEFRKAYFGD